MGEFGSNFDDSCDSVSAQIKKYSKSELSALFTELGELQISHIQKVGFEKGIHFRLTDEPRDKIGKRIIEDFREKLYQKICIEFDYCKKKKNFENLEILAISGMIIPSILQVIGNDPDSSWIPSPLLAVIIAKMGLTKFCNCE